MPTPTKQDSIDRMKKWIKKSGKYNLNFKVVSSPELSAILRGTNCPSELELKMRTLRDYSAYLRELLKGIPSVGEGLEQSSADKVMLSYFTQIVDGCLFELYFPDELHEGNKFFSRHLLAEDLPPLDTMDNKLECLRGIFQKLFHKDHPIRVSIYFLSNLDIVREVLMLRKYGE